MTPPLKVVFLGNHTVGVRTLRALVGAADVVGVVAHPLDPEDGVRYESVFAEAHRLGLRAIRAPGRGDRTLNFIRGCAPDLLWVADYRYLLPASVLHLAGRGAINLHPSLLPAYRGRAPINWAILRGESELGLTAHFIDEGMDTGDIVAQRRFALGSHEDVGDALEKLYPLYAAITAEVIGFFHAGRVPRRMQDHAAATAFPRRTPEDGRIDWRKPAREVWNLIRAVAPPYPGAFSAWPGGALQVRRAAGLVPFETGRRYAPGEVIHTDQATGRMTVACADAGLVLTEFEIPSACGAAEADPQLATACP